MSILTADGLIPTALWRSQEGGAVPVAKEGLLQAGTFELRAEEGRVGGGQARPAFRPARQRGKGKGEDPEVRGSGFPPGQKPKPACCILRGQRSQAETGLCGASGPG